MIPKNSEVDRRVTCGLRKLGFTALRCNRCGSGHHPGNRPRVWPIRFGIGERLATAAYI
jgi:hypothetical protein